MNKQHMSLSWIIRENALVINCKVYVAWKRKMLYDVALHEVIGRHQEYIHKEIYGASIFASG